MGDYSRDTFILTNVLHEYVSGEVVIDPRHYVAVKLQQGVPILDADINDEGEIRRREMEVFVRDVIGDGVPGLGSGFSIDAIEQDNDFAILPGVLIVGGWQVINPATRLYSDLPRFSGAGTDLNTPVGDRTDIVYLDIYEAETAAFGTNPDLRLINENIGIETTTRIERRWTIWVAENQSDFSALVLNEPGHKYYPLARLHRSSSARVEEYMIEDLRRLGLTLADSIKAPMYVRRAGEEVNSLRFSLMLQNLRNIVKHWQQNSLFPVVLSTTESWLSYQNAANEIYYLTTSAEVNSDIKNLDNGDGLALLQKLVDAQHDLLNVITVFGSGIPSEMQAIDLYADYLDGDPSNSIPGIQSALDQNDLLGAVQGQEALTEFLGLSTGDLPQGSVTAILSAVTPATNVTTGEIQLTYTITSELLTPATTEIFTLEALSSDVRWATTLNVSQVSLLPGASSTVVMTVDPANTLVNGDFADINLIARAQRRPSIMSVQPSQRFTIGALPPGETFFFYSGSTDLENGNLPVARADIEEEIYEVEFTLVNSSGGAELHAFEIVYELIWPTILPTGIVPATWIPNAQITLGNQQVPGANTPVIISIRAPDLSAVTEDISFVLSVTTTLTNVDGLPVASGKSTLLEIPVTIEMP